MRLFPSALVTLSSLLPFQFCAAGVGQFAAIAGSGVPPAPKLWFGPPFSPSEARGVPHIRDCTCRLVTELRAPPFILRFIAMCASGDLLSSLATGVIHSSPASCSARLVKSLLPAALFPF